MRPPPPLLALILLIGLFTLSSAPAAGERLADAIQFDPLPVTATGFFCIDPTPPNVNDCDIWLDTDGDGLPGPSGGHLPLGSDVVTDLWVDSGSFVWTAFNFVFDLGDAADPGYPPTCFILTDFDPHISGGKSLPIDDFTHPTRIGIAGFQFPDMAGPLRIATMTFDLARAPYPPGSTAVCIAPIVNVDAPSKFYSYLTKADTYGLFCAGLVDSLCYTTTPASSSENTSWGSVKALFR